MFNNLTCVYEDADVDFVDITDNGNGLILILSSDTDVATVISTKDSYQKKIDFGKVNLQLVHKHNVCCSANRFAFMVVDEGGLYNLIIIEVKDGSMAISKYETGISDVGCFTVKSDFTVAAFTSGAKFDKGEVTELVQLDLITNNRRSYLIEDLPCKHMEFVSKHDILVVRYDFTLVALLRTDVSPSKEYLTPQPIIATSNAESEHIWATDFTAAKDIARYFVAYDDVIKQIDFLLSNVSGKVASFKVSNINHLLDFGDRGNILSIMSSSDGLTLTQAVYHHKRERTEKATRTITS